MRGCMVCLSIEKETVSEASGVILYNKFDNQNQFKIKSDFKISCLFLFYFFTFFYDM